MILRISLLLLALVATFSTASINKQTYVIHMDKSKIPAPYHSSGNSKQWYESMINSIADFPSQREHKEDEEEDDETGSPQILYVYETAIFGFAARLSTKQVQRLSKINGFLSAIPDEMLTLHTTHSPHFLGLQSGEGLWSLPSLATDVIIGIFDTGIWPEHVSFQDAGLSAVPSRWKGACQNGTKFSPSNCNKKIIGAKAFFKGYESLVGRINETVDYRSPRDAQGHGTHTASTAAGNLVDKASFFGLANGSAAGMKYTARIAVYKVCWSLGCTNTDLLAALDQAVADGVDVLSLSLGGTAKSFYSDNVAIASFGATQNGVFVSCSAGNSGPSTSTVDNTAPWIMTVAASYTDRSFPTTVKLGNGQIFTGVSLFSGRATKQLQIVYGTTAGHITAKYCTSGSLKKQLVKGKIVVCERGITGRTAKGEQVKLAGGAGMLLINSEGQGEELFADPHILPACTLGASAGKAIKMYINSTKRPTASISFKGTTYGNPAPAVAAFSSRGPSAVGPEVIKPDVTAPGVNILAAWPPMTSPSMLKRDKRSVLFNVLSGTSMSCPHVSGLAALLKSVHRDWSPAAIKSALMTTAYVLDNKNLPIADLGANNSASATPFAFGSGHVDPESASDPGLIYDITTEDYLNYLCSLNYTSAQVFQVSRRRFSCPNNTIIQPGDLNYPSFAVNFAGNAQNISKTFKRTVTNVGTPSCTYAVQVQEPNGVSTVVKPKILRFRNLGEKLSYKVTFIGLKERDSRESHSFGSLVWVSGKYKVKSPIAVTWR
ncbi:subtilisin-like protease SBT1.1 [Ricinus communis]|uniref:subtilisin-like protease SBT1.1 n=1 Tax=Ricinus communis TaxID=3988 RepID=UPI00201A498A|nr:subtilisin-like protease SBT1.1 [Ricinus communis]